MHVDDAITLISPAVAPVDGTPGVWADLGAGRGTFTRALASLLGPRGRVYAVDRDRAAVAVLARVRDEGGAPVTALLGDFAAPDAHRALALPLLDGIVMANALHFVPAAEQRAVVARLLSWLRPGGRLTVVEYEERAASRWVPYPVSFARLGTLLPASVAAPARAGDYRSAFGGSMYAAYVERR